MCVTSEEEYYDPSINRTQLLPKNLLYFLHTESLQTRGHVSSHRRNLRQDEVKDDSLVRLAMNPDKDFLSSNQNAILDRT